MSDLLIKGMKMPKSCEKCPFLDYEEGFCFASGVKHESGWYESTLCPGGIKDGRHEDCPLVPVPPHGRLIDAEELIKFFPDNGEGSWTYNVVVSSIIRDVPAVIPAEEGE